jgi:hypothetical protein
MAKTIPSQVIPTCNHEDDGAICGRDAMPNTRDCWHHWDIRFSAYWDARFPDEEALPFSEPVEDADYAPDAAYAVNEA